MNESLGGGSNVNPLAFSFLVLMVPVVWRAKPANAVVAILVTAALIPLGQQLVIGGLHFHFFRILLLVGFLRLIVRNELRFSNFNRLDWLVIAWATTALLFGLIKSPDVEDFGTAYNSLGTYFLIRMLLQNSTDFIRHLKALSVVTVIIAVAMTVEYVQRRNVFFIFGGVPEVLMERGDRVRCQGPFRIPILAGTFSATLFPLMVALMGTARGWGLIGGIACALATLLSNSSGPLLSFVAALTGLLMWRMRNRMRFLTRASGVMIVLLAVAMNAPVWWLIARVSNVVGGGGWHRSYVIDAAVKHFNEWWLIGTARTADWAPGGQVLLVDPDNMDITNHFVAQGVSGGILQLGLFIAIIATCFKAVGRLASVDTPLGGKFIWAMGAALAAHCTAFISISYFDQISVFWFWLLAGFSSVISSEAVQSDAWECEPQVV